MESEDTLTLTKDNLVQRTYSDLETNYEIVNELGCGAYARVLRVKNRNTNVEYACKELLKSSISDLESFHKEISILSTLDHPNIIKLYETCENEECIYLIMELCNGGELFDYLITKLEQQQTLTEKEVAHIFKQLMSAVSYCHSNKVSHRDLKPENILITNTSSSSPSSLQIKVIDFGVSQTLTEDDRIMYEQVGTSYYIAPEVLNGSYDHMCDIWSCGVILYVLLCGVPPFNGETDEEIFDAVRRGVFGYPDKLWGNISNDVKDLITKMLCKEDSRLSAEEVLKHPWVVNEAPNAKDETGLNISLNSFKAYLGSNKLKKAVITYIANRLSDEEVCKLQRLFKDIDTNGDGMISLDELKHAMKQTKNVNVKSIEMIFKQIDTDNSGVINYTEFIAACLDKETYAQESKLREAFRLFDLDGDGKVSKYEIMEVLKHETSFAFVDKLLEKYDVNKDGQIDYDEFKALINSN